MSELSSTWHAHAGSSEAVASANTEYFTAEEIAAARSAVADYLRDLGLREPDLIAAESRRLVAETINQLHEHELPSAAALRQGAIQLTVKSLDRWLAALASEASSAGKMSESHGVVGTRLCELLAQYPEALHQTRPSHAAVNSLRDKLTPVVPEVKAQKMRRQRLALLPSSMAWILGGAAPATTRESPKEHRANPWSPLRLLLAGLTLTSSLIATSLFFRVIAGDGFGLLDAPLTLLFGILFVWVAFSFWTATLGLWKILRSGAKVIATEASTLRNQELPVTAVVMPVYNEATTSVFANLRAIAESLRAIGLEKSFHLFVLSDTTKPEIWLAEERAWAKLASQLPPNVRLFYRHRPQNVARKAGNIADFCTRWGSHYRYMVVLDADSVMAGETLAEMVARMELDERIGILQVPPTPVNRQSVFARMQQFASRVYGPVFLEGFAAWSQDDGNYWGHNAIIRVQPFLEHCDLPILPGEGPMGGEILSHDFVEAALMRKAGFKVCLAHDLAGSYEECPTTMLDFAQRDQRWCQGNLQHIRLLLAEGLHPASRLHLGMGAMSYLASPLWFCFLLLTVVGAFFNGALRDPANAPNGFWLFALTMAMLLLPKLWGVIAQVQRGSQSAAPQAWGHTIGSVLLETVVSILIAPIMMLLHTQFVAFTLLGRKVAWNAQPRDDRGMSLVDAAWVHYGHTLAGLGIGLVVWLFVPSLLPWLSPVLLGLVCSIPLSMLLGSAAIGRWLAGRKLLLIPEEIAPPRVLRFQQAALAATEKEEARSSIGSGLFTAVLTDPAFFALHRGILRATHALDCADRSLVQAAARAILSGNWETISPENRRAILGDEWALEKLHVLWRAELPTQRSPLATAANA